LQKKLREHSSEAEDKDKHLPKNTLLQTKLIPEIPPKFALSSSSAGICYYVFTLTNKEMYVER
jgi:hypothetical protein